MTLDPAGHPLVRILHPSSRRPPPYATIVRWTRTAWEELPPSTLAWPEPVPGPRGQLYAYDEEFADRSFRIWDSGAWRSSPDVPGAPLASVRAATADRSTGELIAVLFDGTSLSLARLEHDGWNVLGTPLDARNYSGPESGFVSVAADASAVHVAYVNGPAVVVASLGPNGWTSSSLPTSGPGQASFPAIALGAGGKMLVFWSVGLAPGCEVAVSDGASLQFLPTTAGSFSLFSPPAIRQDDGVPIALFQKGFGGPDPMELAAATWKNGAWELSPIVVPATWGIIVLAPSGDGFTSAASGETIFFTPFRLPR